MTDSTFKSLLDGPFSFTPSPEPIAGDLRMSWGLSVLILGLFFSRGKRGNFQKLQFLGHAVRTPEGRAEVRALLKGELPPSSIAVRVEPWLNRAIAYAHAMKLAALDKGENVILLQAGIDLARKLETLDDILIEERAFLRDVAPKITETLLRKVWRMEDLL